MKIKNHVQEQYDTLLLFLRLTQIRKDQLVKDIFGSMPKSYPEKIWRSSQANIRREKRHSLMLIRNSAIRLSHSDFLVDGIKVLSNRFLQNIMNHLILQQAIRSLLLLNEAEKRYYLKKVSTEGPLSLKNKTKPKQTKTYLVSFLLDEIPTIVNLT